MWGRRWLFHAVEALGDPVQDRGGGGEVSVKGVDGGGVCGDSGLDAVEAAGDAGVDGVGVVWCVLGGLLGCLEVSAVVLGADEASLFAVVCVLFLFLLVLVLAG